MADMKHDRAALVEKVAEMLSYWERPSIAHAIALIRADTLEEAAKCAEYRCGSAEWSADTSSGYECAAKEIATAIRALKDTP